MPDPGIGNVRQSVTTYQNIRGYANQILVTLDDGTKDGGPDGGNNSTKLLPGLIVTRIESGANVGKYTHYDASAATYDDVAEAGVLMDVIEDISTGDQQAAVTFGGGAIFKRSELRYFEAADKTALADLWHEFPVDTIA
jgi:hypothetical protein